MSAYTETYPQWLARMWRVASGLEPLREAEQKLVAQHILDNSDKTEPSDLTLDMLREAESGESAVQAARNADGRHPIG